MFKVEVEFSSRDDNMGNPQWWEYKVVTIDHPNIGFDYVNRDSNEVFAVDSVMDYIELANQNYWSERQLTIW